MRYFLHIAYDGSNYHGWQCQKNVISVQERIESVLAEIFKTPITVYGCGRTDAGVHSSQYFFHIVLNQVLDFDLKFRLNKRLPADISVFEVLEMEPKQHARLDATSRTYNYYIHRNKDPFLAAYSTFIEEENLDLEAMQKAASLLVNYSEFKLFCKKPHLVNNTICKLTHSSLSVSNDKQRLRFTITSNRFLYGMIRHIVFHLIQIGIGKMTLEAFQKLLDDEVDLEEKHLAPPKGLFLSKIEYPYLQAESKSPIIKLLNVGFLD